MPDINAENARLVKRVDTLEEELNVIRRRIDGCLYHVEPRRPYSSDYRRLLTRLESEGYFYEQLGKDET